MARIKSANPVVERDGGDMAHIMGSYVKNRPILPCLDSGLNYDGFGMASQGALTSVRQDGP